MIPIQNNDQYIGQLLIQDGIITRQELERGLEEQRKSSDFLCSTLVRLGFASEERIFSILSLQIGIPYISLKDSWVDPEVLRLVPGGFALAFKCMPMRITDGVVSVAMTDPLNAKTAQLFKKYFHFERLKIFLAGTAEIRQAIRKHYGI